MTATADNVLIGATGSIYFAPLETTLPTDATGTLNAAFKDLGFIGEDGVTEAHDDASTKIKAWGGDVVRTTKDSHDLTYSFKLIETNDDVVAAYYGAGNTAASTSITGAALPHQAMVIYIADGDKDIRICASDAQITERSEIPYKGNEPIGYEVTVTCYPDANGVKAHIYRSL